MRLHDHDFETAARLVISAFDTFEATVNDCRPMVIPYELLAADRKSHIFQISRHLGFWPSLDAVTRIDAATSVDRHRAVMEKVQTRAIEGLTHRRNTNRILVEDSNTLINDRHIQSGAVGRWRQELSAEDQNEANDRFADLVRRYGYAV